MPDDPRELERRILLDTYRTFGAKMATHLPLFSVGWREGRFPDQSHCGGCPDGDHHPTAFGRGFAVRVQGRGREDARGNLHSRAISRRRFFSETTNRLFCKTFLDNALRDPISGEIGKTIFFASARTTPPSDPDSERYGRPDVPRQVPVRFCRAGHVQIPDASNSPSISPTTTCSARQFHRRYKTSKTRVCVTVGMMTTGYDCPDSSTWPDAPHLLAHRFHPDQRAAAPASITS